jgi:hypothetical protein
MKKILGVGFFIPSEEDDYVGFDSQSSLSDFDIAIFYPSFTKTDYTRDYPRPTYEGKDLYSKESSVQISENSSHWANEIKSMLDNGKNVYVVLCPRKDFYIHTGEKEYSGTGRSQKTTNIVTMFHNYRFLPSNIGEISNSSGQIIVPSHSSIKPFYEAFEEYMNYECYIKPSQENLTVLFTTKNKDKVLGGIHKKDKGSIVLLPNIELIDEDEYIGELSKEDIKLGRIFIDHILKIDKSISGDFSKTPTPDWVNHKNYELKEAELTKEKIKEKEEQIVEIQQEIEQLNINVDNQENLKGLLYETGKALENSVIQALKLLGYTAENFNDGKLELDQVINSPEGNRYIGECEGKDNKDIDITKFRQLQDSLNEDFQREEISEKAFGILFGNPQRLLTPSKRNLDFTEKCKNGANREKIGLIKTSDLFRVAKYLLENKDEIFKELCRKEIHNQLGKVVKFPAIPKKSKITKLSG